MTHHCSENHTYHHHCNGNHNVDEEKPKIKFLPYRVDQTPVEYAPGQMIALNISDPTELLITGANDAAKHLLGYEKSDFKNTPTSLKDLVLPSDRTQFNSDIKCLTQKGSEGVLSNPCRVADKNGNPVWFHITIAKLPADSNQSTNWVAFLYNKFTCTLVEQIVDRKITLLRGASNVTKALLVNTDFNTAINESLKILGEASKVDRVYIFENFTDENNQHCMRQRFEWVSRHAHPEIANPDLQSLPYSGEFKMWYNKLSLGQTIKGLVKDVPQEIRTLLSDQKIVSIIIVPIIIEEKFWGYVGFDDCLEPREWTQGEQAVIETVSASLGGAIQKELTACHLAESKMKYKSVVENIEEVVFQTNEKGECIYINDAWKKLSGYSADESLGKCFFEYFDPEHLDFLKNAHKAILHGDKHRIHKEFHLYTTTGSKRWVSVTLLPQKDEKDTITGTFGTLMDTTKRKIVLDSIKRSEKKFKNISNLISDYAYKLIPEQKGNFKFEWLLTGGFFNMLGYSPEEVKALGWMNLVDGHDRIGMEKRIENISRGQTAHTELRLKAKSGKIIWVEDIAYPQKNPETGEVEEVICVVSNITERKESEEALKKSWEKYKNIFNNIEDVYAELGLDGEILEISPSVEKVSGYKRTELIGQKISDYYESMEECENCHKQLMQYGTIKDYEVRLRHKDNSTKVCSFNASVTLSPIGEPEKIVGTMRNITERKKIEDLIKLNEEKYRLLAENAVDLIWQTDLSLTFTYASPSVESVTGFKADEFTKTRLSQHIPFKEFIKLGREVLKAVKNYKTFTSITLESKMYRKDGTLIPIEITGRLLLNKQGKPIGLQGTTKDITERKRIMDELKTQEERTRAINQAIPDFLIEVDTNGNYLNTNHKIREGHQICDDSLTSANIADTKPKVLQEQLLPAFEKAKFTNEIQIFEMQVGDETDEKYVEVRIVPTKVQRYLIIIRDITERMVSEKKINNQLYFLQQLIDSIPNPVFYKNMEGRYLGCNKEFEKYIGLNRDKIIGKTVYDISPTAQANLYNTQDLELFKLKDQKQVYETSLKQANGQKFDVVFHKAAFFDINHKPLGLVGSMLDITDRKKMEHMVIDQKLFFQHVIDTDPNLIMVLNQEDQVELINQSAADFFSLPKEFFLNNNMGKSEHFNKETRKFFSHDQKTLSDNSSRLKTLTLKDSSGNKRQFSIIQKPLKLHNGDICELKIAVDITSLKEKQQKLETLLKDLESANTELKDFAYIVSHDLKAPLRAIGSLSNWLYTDYADNLDEDGKENLELLVGRVKRMHNLIEGILEYSRIGRVHEKIEDIPLKENIEEIVDFLGVPEHISVSVETAMPTIKGEPTRIMQVFQNLISNAVKYNDKEKGEIKIGCKEQGDTWRIYIKDNGPGIDEKYHQKIFQIFQTLSARDERESTGIGLTIVKKVIENYGGSVTLESVPQQGTTFWITMPKSFSKAA